MGEEIKRKKKIPRSRMGSDKMMIFQIYLEELRTLSDEIKQHETSIRNFFIFNLTASGALFGFAFSKSDLISIILFVPILSSILGIISSLHIKRKYQLAHYIRDNLTPRIRLISNDDSVLRWKDDIREQERKDNSKHFTLDSIRLGTLLATSVIGLIASSAIWLSSFSILDFLVWLMGLVLTLVFFYLFAWKLKE